jgi:predicted nucleic acid-binding protein
MLLDTSGLLCVCSPAEALHQAAVQAYEAAVRRVTHGYVLAEFVALANVRGLDRRRTLAFVDACVHDPDLRLVWVDRDLHLRAMELLQSRLDKTYSLCDAVSFVLMKELGIQDALTTDRHFEQEGFRRLLG